ncbi:MAG: tetratricopeptide repeat protein [Deltaproteobacteria bacterium]|nr:MAG: tetratricopeptide repeat protein [Deltaproteobacteria bacterium]
MQVVYDRDKSTNMILMWDRSVTVKTSIEIELFGGVTFRLDGGVLTDFVSRKAEALLVYLVCNPHAHQREAIATLLWDDLPQKRAMANLRLVLTNLRKHLDDFLAITRHTLAWRTDSSYRLDLQEFQENYQSLARVIEESGSLRRSQLLELAEVMKLYKGHFLEGFHIKEAAGFWEWADWQKEQTRQHALRGIKRLLQQLEAHQSYAEGLHWAYQLLQLDSLEEDSHRQVMWFLVQDGQRTAALEQYNRCVEMLEREFDVEPSAETTALYQKIRSMGMLPKNRIPTKPHALIVGREVELAEVKRLLQQDAHPLITILGPGGIGKTHLVQYLAHHLASMNPPLFWDGIVYVPLEQKTTLEQAVASICSTLRLSQTDRSLQEQLFQHLEDKELLLIFDNFEQLVSEESRQFLNTLQQRATSVRVLVTSRERLQLRKEGSVILRGLSYQSGGPNDALQLLQQSAKQADPLATLHPKDQGVIQEICALVNGVPLALELAASWYPALSWPDIAQEIQSNLDFLATDLSDVPDKHRSLRAVFTTSWELLTSEEQKAFTKLSVFSHSFERKAAQAVTGASVRLLLRLGNKHILHQEEGRYHIHGLLRQYAREQYDALPEDEQNAEQLHCNYFLDMLEQLYEPLIGGGQVEAIAKIDSDFDNIQQAWRWNHTHEKNLTRMTRAGYSLYLYARTLNRYTEGRQLFQETYEQLRRHELYPVMFGSIENVEDFQAMTSASNLPAAGWLEHEEAHLFLNAIGWVFTYINRLSERLGEVELLAKELTHVIGLLRQSGNNELLATALFARNPIFFLNDDLEAFERGTLEALEAIKGQDYPWIRSRLYNLLGNLYGERDQTELAHSYYQKAIQIGEQQNDLHGTSKFRQNTAIEYFLRGQFGRSMELFQQCLEDYTTLGERTGQSDCHLYLSMFRMMYGDFPQAVQHAEKSLELSQSTNEPENYCFGMESLGRVRWAQGKYPEAQACMTQAIQLAEHVAPPNTLLEIRLSQAWINWSSPSPTTRQLLQSTNQTAHESKLPDLIARSESTLGWYLYNQGDHKAAIQHFETSCALLEEHHYEWLLPLSLGGLACSQWKGGGTKKAAREKLKRALQLTLSYGTLPQTLFLLTHLAEASDTTKASLVSTLTRLHFVQRNEASWHITQEKASQLWNAIVEKASPTQQEKATQQAEAMTLNEIVAL